MVPLSFIFFCFFVTKVSSFYASTHRHDKATARRSNAPQFMVAAQQLGSFQVLDHIDREEQQTRRVLLQNYVSEPSKTFIEYNTAWNWQKDLLQHHSDRIDQYKKDTTTMPTPFWNDSRQQPQQQVGRDTILMLEHEPVLTLGTASDEAFILNNDNTPIIRMDRGGEVTYHGPGQLTVYPVLDLRHYRQDIHWFMRALEESIILALQECGIDAQRDDDTTGVWVDNYKVAAIGIKCRKWITQHGLAVNVESTSLDGFEGIVPCGLEGRKVGYLNQFLNMDSQITVSQFATYMESALEEVFRIRLVRPGD